MKKTAFILVCLLTGAACAAQDTIPAKARKVSSVQLYGPEYRETFTFPPFDRKKIEKLLMEEETKKAQEDARERKARQALPNDDDSDRIFTIWRPYISPQVYASLSLRERYVFHISYPEDYTQTCGVIHSGGESRAMVGARLPFFYQRGFSWSKAQDLFFRENKDSVLAWISADIKRTGRAGLNYKYAIVQCSDKRMIPLLIATYRREKADHDLLTVMLLLMSNAKYPPFLRTDLYRKLYGPGVSPRRAEIAYNPANEKAILALAKDYYLWTEDVSSN